MSGKKKCGGGGRHGSMKWRMHMWRYRAVQSMCEFQGMNNAPGKVYNCDLNATYNIGARYFLRKMETELKTVKFTKGKPAMPAPPKRTTCVLSDLTSYYAEYKKRLN